MTTRTIIAADMQHAMSQAKMELGSEAIIVSSRKVGDAIEVTVTDDLSILKAFKPKSDAANDESNKKQSAAASALPFDVFPPKSEPASPTRSSASVDESEPSIDELGVEPPSFFEDMPSILDTFEQSDILPDQNEPPEDTYNAQPESRPQPQSPPQPQPQPQYKAKPAPVDRAVPKEIGESINAKRFSFESMHDPALKRLIGELKSIGEFWNEFGVYWESHAEAFQYPWSKQLRERIDYLHLSSDLRDQLVRQYKEIPEFENSWQLVLSGLQQKINISRSDIINNGGSYAFVGPSGAGKTTTIGKVAAEYVLQHGADEVGLITTDIFRIAAYEQLTTMGKILDVDVEVVDAHQGGLVDALERYSNKSLILIDTAGLRRNDRDLAQQLAQIRQQGQRLQTMLVLPANLQYESMMSAMETYETDDYQGCIFTRLDECNSMGAAVSLLVNTGIPAAYLASGHTIPDDLARATSLLIIEQLLSFACQEVDVSKVGSGKIADRFSPEADRQIDLI